jgi:hypothetical protein
MDTNFYGRIVKRMKDQKLVLMCVNLYVVWMIKMLDIEMEKKSVFLNSENKIMALFKKTDPGYKILDCPTHYALYGIFRAQ